MRLSQGFDLNGNNIRGVSVSLSIKKALTCPFCHLQIETQPMVFLFIEESAIQIFLKCKSCKNSFIGYADRRYIPYDDDYTIYQLSKGNHKEREFPKAITDISEAFVKVYGEAEYAEQEKLMEICGVGYRKALEYLIKDYLISIHPDNEDETKGKFLSACIKEMIDDPKIKMIAERATWLGNDETHYIRKWEDKDVQDLKKLIGILVAFISKEIEASRYIAEMQG